MLLCRSEGRSQQRKLSPSGEPAGVSAADAISTKERVSCVFPTTTVTSPWSVLESADELKELDEPSPRERPLAPRLPPS